MNPALIYFDLFDYPLTWLERERFKMIPSPRRGEGQGEVGSGNGFYFVQGRKETVVIRQERYLIAQRKYKRALRVAKILARLPFMRMIAVCNSLSYNNARENSDIDLFVITSGGGAWWARFFCLLFLKLLRLRPGQGGQQDKICLSFFVDENNLDLSRLRLGADDIYFTYWLATLYPIYDESGYYQALWQANEYWLKPILPNARPTIPHPARTISSSGFSSLDKKIDETILRPFSAWIEKLQIKLLPTEILNMMNKDTRVRVERGILKFHVNDRREQYAREFAKAIN